MFSTVKSKFAPFLLGLMLAGCASLATTGDRCAAVADISDDELWELEPESSTGAGLSGQAAVPKVAATQLIELIASKTNLNKKEAGEALFAMLDGMNESFKQGKTVGLPGIGTIRVSYTKARTGRNPKTGETIQISASSHLAIKTASTLKDLLPKTDPYADPAPAPTP